jgi:hypothetical protein
MLTNQARVALSQEEVAGLLRDDREELRSRASDFSSTEATRSAEATLFLEGGEEAHLRLDEGRFYLDSVGAVPAGPKSPAEVLLLLRKAIAARSVERVSGLLSESGREAFESFFESLETSLQQSDSAIIEVRQESATIELPDGLIIDVVREEGVWKVEDVR